jgi:NTE family protein
VIQPHLEGLTGTDYRKSAQLVRLGYEAAEAQADSLLPLALDEAAWQAHLAARRAQSRTLPERVDFYDVTGVEEGEATRLEQLLDLRVGPGLDQERLARTLSRIVGTGRYAAASYGLAQHGDETGLAVSVREKRHAPPFVNFFTHLTNRGEDIDFNLGARVTFLDLTSYGSELRVEGGVGSAMGLGGELLQPVGGGGLFAAVTPPSASSAISSRSQSSRIRSATACSRWGSSRWAASSRS